MNKAILIGRLTADPEVANTASGISVSRFSLAVDRRYKDQNGEKLTDFLNIVVWRDLADNCGKYLKKGSKCAVVGSVQTRSYEDQKGNKRYITEIVAEQVEFLDSKQQSNYDYGELPPATKQRPGLNELEPIDDDDLPF